MQSKPHLRRLINENYNPWETRQDLRVRCPVCGWAGIDPIATQEPEQAIFGTETTGTTYVIPTGTSASGLAAVLDFATETTYGANSGCPFCGSPLWNGGSAPDLHW